MGFRISLGRSKTPDWDPVAKRLPLEDWMRGLSKDFIILVLKEERLRWIEDYETPHPTHEEPVEEEPTLEEFIRKLKEARHRRIEPQPVLNKRKKFWRQKLYRGSTKQTPPKSNTSRET